MSVTIYPFDSQHENNNLTLADSCYWPFSGNLKSDSLPGQKFNKFDFVVQALIRPDYNTVRQLIWNEICESPDFTIQGKFHRISKSIGKLSAIAE